MSGSRWKVLGLRSWGLGLCSWFLVLGFHLPSPRLWLAVFENASSLAVAQVLKEHGAQDGFLLDGGHSTNMVLGPKAAHVRSGSLLWFSRPVAMVVGVRCQVSGVRKAGSREQGAGRRGDAETRRRGDAETRRRGDAGTRGAGSRERGAGSGERGAGSREQGGRGDAGTRGGS